ncbi:MAG: macrocin O-methyltransferase [Methylacidiphilaceae bacterium]|nr:macrocin O-methyltransferase [Candidatus Methylacidiphilaceae bacterium]
MRSRYLALLQKTLTRRLWRTHFAPVFQAPSLAARSARWITDRILSLPPLAKRGMVLLQTVPESVSDDGSYWPIDAHTMVGWKRLENLRACVETVLAEGVEGDLLEAGVWRGGAAIFLKGILFAHRDQTRRVFVADSFAGLPEPRPGDPMDAQLRVRNRVAASFLAVSEEEVRDNFARYDLLDDKVVFLKGFFHETLPKAPIEKLALLRADGDMFRSTMDVLESLYDKLSPGGFCIIDDYALAPCRAAVEAFRERRRISEPLTAIDWSGVYWRKEAS